MKTCGGDSDCRASYTCRLPSEVVNRSGQPVAAALDPGRADVRFCVAGPRDADLSRPLR